MTTDPPRSARTGSTALLVASAGMLVTMGLHPTGPETLRIAEAGGRNLAARGVHVLALAMQPPLLLGLLALTRRLRARHAAADLAMLTWALATVCIVVAATASGLIATRMVEEIAEAGGATREWRLELMHFTAVINRAFAALFTGFAGMAVALWSWAMRHPASGFPAAVAWLGLTGGAAAVLSQLTGVLRLDVRGFGLVVVVLALWLVWVAVLLRRPVAADAASVVHP
ncbi:MAG: hypothetical protein MUF53_06995, partial [Gemmatimonadaceae bacterium]|nr:hypothetical protein [Gemmatimonadaceae bacterium]